MRKNIDQDSQSSNTGRTERPSEPRAHGAWHSKSARLAFDRMKQDIRDHGSISDYCKGSLRSPSVSSQVIRLLAKEFHGCENRILQPGDSLSAQPLWPMIERAIWDAAGVEGVRSLHERCSAFGSKYSRIYRSGCEHLCFRGDLESEFSDTQKWGIIKPLGGTYRTHLYETNGQNSIKLIIRAERRARFYERLYVRSRGFPVEEPLGYRMNGTYGDEGIGYVFTSFVGNAVVLDDENVSKLSRTERFGIASMIVDLLAATHNECIVHTHPHNGNFLYIPGEKRIVMIDSPYKFGDEAKKHRLDTLIYFLLRANGQRIVPEIDDYWHKLRTVKLVEKEDIDPLLRRYLTSSIIDYRNLHAEAQRISYGVYSRHSFEYADGIHSIEGAVKYLMKRLEFLQEYHLHG
jgi:hypothetical protein